MRVSKTLETAEGTVKFEGELNQHELDLIIATGLNFLLGQGVIPFKVMQDKDSINLVEGSDQQQ